MPRRTLLRAAALVAVVPCVLGMGAPRSTARAAHLPRLSHVTTVVALGDSVPAGTRCRCIPFPQQVAARIRGLTGRNVTTYNDSVSGYRTGDVLAQLRWNPTVIGHVRRANVVEVMIGANDIAYSRACRASTSCYQSALAAARVNTVAIVDRIHALTSGHRVAVVLLGYWNAWLDGSYAAAQGSSYVAASRSLTRQQNASILAIARATRSLYVDTWLAFRGTADADDTGLLAYDGDHPNAAGHARIAAAVTAALRASLPA